MQRRKRANAAGRGKTATPPRAHAHATISLDEKVRGYLSRMRPGTEIDARGLAREFGGAEPIAVDYALLRAQKAGLAISDDGKWFGPAPVTTHHARKKGASDRAGATAPKRSLPRYDARRGWIGGDNRTLYTFTDRSTRLKVVHPGGGTGKKVLANMGPEMDVRVASQIEAEELWQRPLHSGWNVNDHATKKVAEGSARRHSVDESLRPAKKALAQIKSPLLDFTIHSGQYRVRVVPDSEGYRAKLISVGIGTIMEPHGNSPTEALIELAGELYADGTALNRKMAKDIARQAALPIVWA